MKTKGNALRQLIWAAAIMFLFTGETVLATEWTIEDNYIGKYYPSPKHDYRQTNVEGENFGDVIALDADHVNNYDIDNMVVDIDGQGNITVTIKTDYNWDSNNDGISDDGTYYGDLFISTTGWYPSGEEDTYYSNGTSWEYVFDTETKSLYDASEGKFKLSQNLLSLYSYEYRKNQLVQFNPDNEEEIPTGTFDTSQDGFLIYSGFNLSDLGGLSLDDDFELAFRWTMTCANDAIEGSIKWQAVPEPGTMMLFGMGILGLGIAGRRTRKPVRGES